MMRYDITNEEREALRIYKGFNYDAINQLLTSSCEEDIALLSDALENSSVQTISYRNEDVIKNIEIVKKVYELMIKMELNREKSIDFKFVRGTNLYEVQKFKNEPYIDRMLSATINSDVAFEKYASVYDNPAIVNILGSDEVPKILVSDVLSDIEDKDEVIISPFTQIVEFKDLSVLDENGEGKKVYNICIEKQKLEELSELERKGLYKFILQNTDAIEGKLAECVQIEREIKENSENIRKLEQLLLKYEDQSERKIQAKDYPETEKKEDLEDIERINNEISKIKDDIEFKFENKKALISFITTWKRNVILYLMSECREIEYKYRAEENVKQEFDNEKLKKLEEETKEKMEKIEKEEVEELKEETKGQISENMVKVNTLLDNIKLLINKEQNHAKVAGNLGSVYSALNNGFEMRKVAETLKGLIENINLKKEALLQSEDDGAKEKLENISKVNVQVGTLINYLNNPKTAIPGTKVTRFDEMIILEENELKRGLAERIRDVLGEAELRKLKDDLEYLENRSGFERFIGIFTGQNKLDDLMIEQIIIRRDAIKRKLAGKMSLAYNYSIHDLVAKIRMFIRENDDDDLVFDTIEELRTLDAELKRNFVINDTRVETIIYAKEGKDLPVDNNKKISKAEQLEIDTYQFLNKYEYDLIDDLAKTEKYQDTLANEIAMIVDYINSSNVLK